MENVDTQQIYTLYGCGKMHNYENYKQPHIKIRNTLIRTNLNTKHEKRDMTRLRMNI